MSFHMQEQGSRFIAELLAGSGQRINGMYIECSRSGGVDVCCPRNPAYFEAAKNIAYARVAISHAYVGPDLGIHFDALVSRNDFNQKYKQGSVLACATLACFKDDNPANDIFICTTEFPKAVTVPADAFVTVHTCIKLG